MKDYDLLNPGIDQLGQTVRSNVAKLISNAKNESNPSGEVAAFLLDAAQKAPKYIAPPAPPLPALQAIIGEGDLVDLSPTGGTQALGKVTVKVSSNRVTRVQLPATLAAVKDGDTVPGGGTTWKLTVQLGKVVGIEEVIP